MEQRLTAGVTDLDTSLTNVHGDDFTHFEEMKKAEMTWKVGQESGGKTTRSTVLTELAKNCTDAARQNKMKGSEHAAVMVRLPLSHAPLSQVNNLVCA